ncbi:MAG: SEC-C domain-containing protein [Phycisphaerales bacterium]|nr:MAG: SEC-C domain-containing protein [Phycisphaerales bacterium]
MSVFALASNVIKGAKQLPRRVFGTHSERMMKGYRRRSKGINDLEAAMRGEYDEQLASHSAAVPSEGIDAEERGRLVQRLRVELSEDLRERTRLLRERMEPYIRPLEEWWESIDPTERLEEYYKGEYRKRHDKVTEALDDEGVMAEAFAILREASRRAQDHRHFDCQLVGGRVLFEGRIAEMRTGEGKTIVCHLAAFVKVLFGHKVHIITVNDYLVKRDAEFAAPIFELLGISVGYIQAMVDPGGHEGIRRHAYACDITYGTNSEFGFDYLRDNMKVRLEDQVQGPLDYVIVDEVDSILIDEARTPLIISGPAHDDVTRYPRANKVAEELIKRQRPWDRKVEATVAKYDGETHNIPKLGDAMAILGYKEIRAGGGKDRSDDETPDAESVDGSDESDEQPTLGPDFLTDDQVEAIQFFENDVLRLSPAEQYRRYFIVHTERKQVGLTHEGVTIAQDMLDIGSLYSLGNSEWPHLIENALRAHKVYNRDVDYVVQEGQVIIVDPFTGRLMHGRQWSDGLHQAVESKERVHVKEETQTLATITIQNFVKLYRVKAGMTGTAVTEATEFDKIYKLDVIEIPTNRPVNRVEHNDKMYRDTDQKFQAIVDEIHEVHRRGRPADPFLLADVFSALRPILAEQGQDTEKIDETLRQFNAAEFGDTKVINFMLETYDEVMGELARGRPILVGTTSVENSEKVSKLLERRYGIEHEVLNAKNHAREAEIVAKAGHCTIPTHGRDKTPVGNVTIATNMAGRGTDIKLAPGVVYSTCKVPDKLPEGIEPGALYPPGVSKCCIHCEEYDPTTNCAHCYKPKLDSRFPALGRKVCSLNVPCGLHIIGTERHEARRIDNQLRGRSGRQGDPGSSRFSLSLQDDLLKLFMSDWMLKMMERLGFTEGGSLEDKRLTKGIEKAQRKVEERNFSTRKHLLEWDEPMDFQRKEFYGARQRILEERDLPGIIFDTIDNTLETTLQQYLGGTFNRTCIVEWCRTQLDVTIAEDSIDMDDFDSAKESIRQKAKDEAFDMIRTSIGEYIDVEEPPNKWDVGGLLGWAQRLYKVPLTQNQLRKMDPSDIEDALVDAATAHYDRVDFNGMALYLDPHYPQRALAEWARLKFGIKVDDDELIDTPRDDVAATLKLRVREAYRQRELSYPIESCIERAFGMEGTDNATAADMVVSWANNKYRVGWELQDVQGKPPEDVRDTLLKLNESYWNGKLAEEVDANIKGKDRKAAVEWARSRFGPAWSQRRFAQFDGDLREAVLDQGREMLRWELTRLEQAVLQRIYDLAWKDHLLEMDHLKDAIAQRPLGGDQAHPQSQFAIEGRELFTQMWARISSRVADIIFKIRASGGEQDGRGGRSGMQLALRHADATGAGFASAVRDQAAAMRAQGVEQKVETIRRKTPKVGRNEPCPCGSGKKYKSCHGRA